MRGSITGRSRGQGAEAALCAHDFGPVKKDAVRDWRLGPVKVQPLEMLAAFSVTVISSHQHICRSVIAPFIVLRLRGLRCSGAKCLPGMGCMAGSAGDI